MKKTVNLILIILILLMLVGCSDNGTADVQRSQVPANATQKTPAGKADGAMTPTADALGITAENYPKIDGSTSTLSIVQAIFRAMYGEAAYDLDTFPTQASKTVPSYNLLIDGKVDMIIVPYASADVLKRAEKAGVELEFHKVAAEALIFITSVENPTESITLEQVREIYLNYGITNWRELRGPDRELVPICRNADSGSQSQMDNLILNNEEMHPDIRKNYVELTMEGMLEQVACYHHGGLTGKPTNSYALGYTLYTYLHQMNEMTGIGEYLKILAFDGVMPTAENIADNYYPLADGYYAVVRSDLPQDHSARAIITWLQGKDGAAAIERIGLIPCADENKENYPDILVQSPMTISNNDLFPVNGQHQYLRIKMVKGKYYEDWSPGAYQGTLWEGDFIIELADANGKAIAETDLSTIFEEPLIFHAPFDLQFDDYNADGDVDFTIGQYKSSNGKDYKLFTLKEHGRIELLPIKDYSSLFISKTTGYYSTKLKKLDSVSFKVEYYDNTKGRNSEAVFKWNGKEFVKESG